MINEDDELDRARQVLYKAYFFTMETAQSLASALILGLLVKKFDTSRTYTIEEANRILDAENQKTLGKAINDFFVIEPLLSLLDKVEQKQFNEELKNLKIARNYLAHEYIYKNYNHFNRIDSVTIAVRKLDKVRQSMINALQQVHNLVHFFFATKFSLSTDQIVKVAGINASINNVSFVASERI